MSRLRKSDAQLDAEAAGRRPTQLPFWVVPSASPLQRWQAAYHAEPPSKLTTHHPPALRYDSEGEDEGEPELVIEATAVGVDLSNALVEWVDAGFPAGERSDRIAAHGRNLVHDALLLWDRQCRSKHRRWPDHRGRAICAELAWYVIRDRCSVSWSAAYVGVTPERAYRLLALASEFMVRRQRQWLDAMHVRIIHDRDSCSECRIAS